MIYIYISCWLRLKLESSTTSWIIVWYKYVSSNQSCNEVFFPHGSGGEISLVSYANKKSTIPPKYIFFFFLMNSKNIYFFLKCGENIYIYINWKQIRWNKIESSKTRYKSESSLFGSL